jgi:hypothetical protein
VVEQHELLEHHAQPVRAQAADEALGQPLDGGPATRTEPDVGRSSPAARFSSVVLPEPDGPTTATNSPLWTSSETPRIGSTGGLPG